MDVALYQIIILLLPVCITHLLPGRCWRCSVMWETTPVCGHACRSASQRWVCHKSSSTRRRATSLLRLRDWVRMRGPQWWTAPWPARLMWSQTSGRGLYQHTKVSCGVWGETTCRSLCVVKYCHVMFYGENHYFMYIKKTIISWKPSFHVFYKESYTMCFMSRAIISCFTRRAIISCFMRRTIISCFMRRAIISCSMRRAITSCFMRRAEMSCFMRRAIISCVLWGEPSSHVFYEENLNFRCFFMRAIMCFMRRAIISHVLWEP